MTRAYYVRYAYDYKCPQVACYDGVRMLIVRFRAKDREDMQTCNGDMFVIPNIAGPDSIHIRYALYCLLVDGLHRNTGVTIPLCDDSPLYPPFLLVLWRTLLGARIEYLHGHSWCG
jgi:hypothetical protein